MKTLLRPAALASSLLLLAPADSVGFAPEEDSEVAKRFRTDCEVVLEDLYILINGEEADPEILGIPPEFSVSFGYALACSDRYEKVGAGRPLSLLRTFTAFEGWFIDDEGEEVRENSAELEQAVVRFRWDEEEQAFDREFVGEADLGAEELSMLAEDLDLRSLLPDREVSEGDRWQVTGQPLLSILLPGLDAPGLLRSEEAAELSEEAVSLLLGLGEKLRATCQLEGTEEFFGRELARISFSCALDEELDLDPASLGLDLADALEGQGTFELSVAVDFEGVCLWDQEAGRFHSFEMDGEGEAVLDVSVDVTELGLTLEATAELSLELLREATVKPL